jgi:TolB-like protein
MLHSGIKNLPSEGMMKTVHKVLVKILLVIIFLSFSAVQAASKDALDEAEQIIVRKLSEDKAYFNWRLKQKKKGIVPKDIKKNRKEVFKKEVARARVLVPVIDYIINTANKKKKGERINLKKVKAPTYRVLSNYLNLIGTIRSGNFERARVIANKINLTVGFGKTQSMKDFGLALTRHLYYMKGIVLYNLREDKKAVRWFGQIKADVEVRAMNLKKKRDLANTRLADLHKKPVAVSNFVNLTKAKDAEWISGAASEVIINDLSGLTTLKLIERQRMADILREAELGMLGIVDEDDASKVGGQLGAGTIVIGSYSVKNGTFTISGRLVHVESGTVLNASMKQGSDKAIIATTREMSIDLLSSAGLLTALDSRKIQSARMPKEAAVKAIAEAKLLMASKPEEARELFEKAMKSDPTYANAFNELRMKFKDVTAMVAVMPFSNTTQKKEDDWMKEGIAESLMSDIEILGFNTVERLQLRKVIQFETDLTTKKSMGLGSVSDDSVSFLGKKLAVNFMVVGSYQRFSDQLKINMRFLDVETAQILYSSSVQGKYQDYPVLIVDLINNLGKHLNRPLDSKQMEKMVQGKPSLEEFKKFMRKQVAQDELALKANGNNWKEKQKQDEETKRELFRQRMQVQIQERLDQANQGNEMRKWISVGGIGGGLLLTVLGQILSVENNNQASKYQALAEQSIRLEDIQTNNSLYEDYKNKGTAWSVVSYTGLAVAAAGAVYWFLTSEPDVDLDGLEYPQEGNSGFSVGSTETGLGLNYSVRW